MDRSTFSDTNSSPKMGDSTPVTDQASTLGALFNPQNAWTPPPAYLQEEFSFGFGDISDSLTRYEGTSQPEASTMSPQLCSNCARRLDLNEGPGELHTPRRQSSPLESKLREFNSTQTPLGTIWPNLTLSGFSKSPSPQNAARYPLYLGMGMGASGLISPPGLGHPAMAGMTGHFIPEPPILPGPLLLPMGIKVPQRPYKCRTSRSGQPSHIASIIFVRENGDGFLIKDGLDRNYAGLKYRDEAMFSTQSNSSISIRIEWPNYPPWSRQIKTRDYRNPPRQITLAKLATEIAKSLKLFIEEMDVNSDERNDDVWGVGTIDSGRISVDNVVLVSLEPVTESSWQPVFYLRN